MTDSILHSILEFVATCQEYQIIPHVDTPEHKEVEFVDDVMGLCQHIADVAYEHAAARALSKPFDNAATVFALLINPNTTSFWNRRREALKGKILSPSEDVHLTRLILKTRPRSAETIFHRQWIFTNILLDSTKTWLAGELEFCDELAGLYRMNYWIWQYRRVLLQLSEPAVYRDELFRIQNWLISHPTDSSGWSYLAWIVNLLCSPPSSIDPHYGLAESHDRQVALVRNQLDCTREILNLYPERECVWLYRRQLLQLLYQQSKPGQFKIPDAYWLPRVRSTVNRVMNSCCLRPTNLRLFSSVDHFVQWCTSQGLVDQLPGRKIPWWLVQVLRECLWLRQYVCAQNAIDWAENFT